MYMYVSRAWLLPDRWDLSRMLEGPLSASDPLSGSRGIYVCSWCKRVWKCWKWRRNCTVRSQRGLCSRQLSDSQRWWKRPNWLGTRSPVLQHYGFVKSSILPRASDFCWAWCTSGHLNACGPKSSQDTPHSGPSSCPWRLLWIQASSLTLVLSQITGFPPFCTKFSFPFLPQIVLFLIKLLTLLFFKSYIS